MRVLSFQGMLRCMNMQQGPARRALLEGAAGTIFRDVVAAGVLEEDDPRLSKGHEDHRAVRVLIDLGLLRQAESGGWVAADPTTAQSDVVAPMGRQVAELLSESAAWADTFASLAQVFRRTTPTRGNPIDEIRGLPNINRFLEAAVDDAENELLTAQPAGARRAVILDQAVDRDLRTIERGVHMRTLYQHTARRSKATRDYVNLMLAHGGQVRTLDEFFNRLIVIDRRLAIIPGEASDVALAIHDTNLVSYLADIFDRSWERAREYNERGSASDSDIAAEVRQLTVRMLTEGHSDPASAKRVGVSTRTYASYVAALKEEYGVETRFQLGYAMGTRDSESAPDN